jgi:beta-glucosidase
MITKRILLSLTILLAWDLQAQSTKAVYLDDNQPIEVRVENLLSQLTFDEKFALLHAQSKFSISGVPRLGIPEIWMSDGPHGVKHENSWNEWSSAKWTNDSSTAFPSLTCLAASWNPSLSYIQGKVIGAEARYRNKDVMLGPGVNIARTPLNGRNFEYMGEDPYLTSKLVVPYINGIQENGVAACVKHYILNDQETNKHTISVELSNRALNEIHFPPFEAAVREANVQAIMSSYNLVRGFYASDSEFLLTTTLKKKWGFKGVVISDWDAVHSTYLPAINGLDIEMGTEGKDYKDYFFANPLKEMVKSGKVSQQIIDDKVRRILRLNFLTRMNKNRPWGSFGTTEHAMATRKIAEEGIVLLKNTNKILPLHVAKTKSIAVIGDNATRAQLLGGGSSSLKARYEISPLAGLKNRLKDSVLINYTQGYTTKGQQVDSLFNKALEAARKSDMVLFFGGLNKTAGQDSEGHDRINMKLPYNQDSLIIELLKVNPNMVVVLNGGNPMELPWNDKVPALLLSWYPGMEGGNAIARVLFGDVNPSGKLPVTFPKKLDDSPAHALGTFPGEKTKVEYLEDIFVGYRWFDKKKIAPLYPFGFGLSYTSFALEKINTDKKEFGQDETASVSITLKNTGLKTGAEVVQLYVSAIKPKEDRPANELKAFQKIELKAGEQKTITFEITPEMLRYYSMVEDKWVVPSGQYRISIGNSSRNLLNSVILRYK